MQANQIRLGILSAVLGGVLVAGVGTVAMNRASANTSPDPLRTPPATIVVAPTEVHVPGYTGPLYDGQGKIVGVASDRRASAFAPSRPLGQTQYNGTTANGVKTHNRSTGKSVAIVAGSAGAGAAIGALAGGGKGAGIGAASGGTAGFIFDRMTAHKP